MNWTMDCAVVVPCVNEERTIGPLVTAIRRYLPRVFVVDDGSLDRTAVMAAKAGAEVLQHNETRGKGAALQTGWQRARAGGFAWTLSMDGDGQHAPKDIPAFLSCAERTGGRLVIGDRMHNDAAMPPLRRFVNRWMSRRISRAAGVPLPDSQCGFRLMHLETWAALPIRATHFEIESDTLLAFAAHGCPIEFVPVQVIYRSERSKIHPVRDTVRWFRWWRTARKTLNAGNAAKRKAIEAKRIPADLCDSLRPLR